MNYTNEVINYIEEKYSVSPERPWMEYPENRTFKEPASQKWFALIMPVPGRKLGTLTDEEIYVVNVKSDSDFISFITQSEGYVPGYHMNKQHWLTVFLDGTVPIQEIFARIDESYERISDTPAKRIYEAVKRIPAGHVATYGQVAEMAGNKKMARAVGNALRKCPDCLDVPCFRVVNAKGELACKVSFGRDGEQEALLREDGVEVINGIVDLKKYGMVL